MTEQPLIQYDLLILCNLRSAEIGGATYDSLTVKLLKSSSYTLLCVMKKNYELILTSICNKQNSSTSSTYIILGIGPKSSLTYFFVKNMDT